MSPKTNFRPRRLRQIDGPVAAAAAGSARLPRHTTIKSRAPSSSLHPLEGRAMMMSTRSRCCQRIANHWRSTVAVGLPLLPLRPILRMIPHPFVVAVGLPLPPLRTRQGSCAYPSRRLSSEGGWRHSKCALPVAAGPTVAVGLPLPRPGPRREMLSQASLRNLPVTLVTALPRTAHQSIAHPVHPTLRQVPVGVPMARSLAPHALGEAHRERELASCLVSPTTSCKRSHGSLHSRSAHERWVDAATNQRTQT